MVTEERHGPDRQSFPPSASAAAVSAAPEVNLRPTASGVEVHVRYITQAQERSAMRARLNQALVEQLLYQRGAGEKSGAAAAG